MVPHLLLVRLESISDDLFRWNFAFVACFQGSHPEVAYIDGGTPPDDEGLVQRAFVFTTAPEDDELKQCGPLGPVTLWQRQSICSAVSIASIVTRCLSGDDAHRRGHQP